MVGGGGGMMQSEDGEGGGDSGMKVMVRVEGGGGYCGERIVRSQL